MVIIENVKESINEATDIFYDFGKSWPWLSLCVEENREDKLINLPRLWTEMTCNKSWIL